MAIIRSRDSDGIIEFLNPKNKAIYISVASEAEIKSIARKANWGNSRIEKLENILDAVTVVEINQFYINAYVEIDTFSQRSNAAFSEYNFTTPRNMGKNDLWIASLGSLLGLQLVTTDADFDHLHEIFFEVRRIIPTDFLIYF